MIGFTTSDALDLPGITHGFFGRAGGVSRGTAASLNAGYGGDDTQANVNENRRRIAAALGTARSSLLSCDQHHSRDVVIADAPWPDGYRPKADAVVTRVKGIACSALAADCAPVLLADAQNGVIGAAHAGWRGALSGITDAAIDAMESIGAKRSNIVAVVGPCISAANYEVGPEFQDGFLAQDATNARFFTQGQNDRLHFDLKAYVTARILGYGASSAQALPDCTYGLPDAYFSYRYNTHQGVAGYGRNISAIMLS